MLTQTKVNRSKHRHRLPRRHQTSQHHHQVIEAQQLPPGPPDRHAKGEKEEHGHQHQTGRDGHQGPAFAVGDGCAPFGARFRITFHFSIGIFYIPLSSSNAVVGLDVFLLLLLSGYSILAHSRWGFVGVQHIGAGVALSFRQSLDNEKKNIKKCLS